MIGASRRDGGGDGCYSVGTFGWYELKVLVGGRRVK